MMKKAQLKLKCIFIIFVQSTTGQAGTSSGPKTPLGGTPTNMRTDRERKIGHRRVDEAGQVTYKKVSCPLVL